MTDFTGHSGVGMGWGVEVAVGGGAVGKEGSNAFEAS